MGGVSLSVRASAIASSFPDDTRFQVGHNAGQVHRFCNEIAVGDRVVTYGA